jgi:inhibitor of cysteine peptidase
MGHDTLNWTLRRKTDMKTKIIAAMLTALVLPAAAACSPATETAAQEASIEVAIDEFQNATDITREVAVAEGGTLTLTLGSNPTTGFSWNEAAQIADPTVLQQTSSESLPAEGQGMVGAPGAQVWTFKALKKGTTTVSLDYSRPWEGGEKGVWTFELAVTVK